MFIIGKLKNCAFIIPTNRCSNSIFLKYIFEHYLQKPKQLRRIVPFLFCVQFLLIFEYFVVVCNGRFHVTWLLSYPSLFCFGVLFSPIFIDTKMRYASFAID